MAVRAGKVEIEQPELEEAIDRVLMGPARKSHLLTAEELWRIAVHESGHAVVAKSIEFPTALQKLSVVARGRGRGGATIYATSDQLTVTELDLLKQLVAMMGGVAAESYVFGMLSTGVEGDIDHATKLAHSMCASYGMSPAIGPVAIGEAEGQVFIGRDLANMGNVAAASLELVDSEVRRFVHDAEETAKRVLMLNSVRARGSGQLAAARGDALGTFARGVHGGGQALARVLDQGRRPRAADQRAHGRRRRRR